MKLERIGEWVQWPYLSTTKDKCWIKPFLVKVRYLTTGQWAVEVATGAFSEFQHRFETESEAQAFAREIMEGGK